MPAEVMPAGYLQLGEFELGVGTSALCVVTLKPKSGSKIDKKEADGKKGAATTYKGAKPADWECDLVWNNRPGIDDDNDAAIEEILYQLSPNGPNPGKAYDFAAKRARVHGTSQAVIEDVEGPEDAPGTSEVKAKIKFTAWTKPDATTQGQGDATTPTKADKWPDGAKSPTDNLPAGFGREHDSPSAKP